MSLYDTKKKGQWDSWQQEKDRIKNHGQGNTAAVGKNTGLSFTLNARQQAEYDRMDESQQELFKYMMNDPSADMSKINMTGKTSQAKPVTAGTTDKPTLRPAVNYGEPAKLETQEIRFQPKTSSSGILDSLSPRQRAEYDGMSEDEQNLFRYFMHDPDVDVSKLSIMGGAPKKTKNTSTETPVFQKLFLKASGSYPSLDTTETYYQYLIRQAEENPALYSNPNYAQEVRRTEQRMEQEQPVVSVGINSPGNLEIPETSTYSDNGSGKTSAHADKHLPEHNDNFYDELWGFLKQPQETIDHTVRALQSINSEVRQMKQELKGVEVYPYRPWTTLEASLWQGDKRYIDKTDRIVNNYKDGWISAYRDVIKKAAEVYDIPTELLACVAWIEVAGDPMWADPAAYGAREFIPDMTWDIMHSLFPKIYDKLHKFYLDASETSFGYVSMQLGVAANMIGLDSEDLNLFTEARLSQVLSDPKTSIMFAAKHLAQLKNIDFPDIPSSELTLDEMKVIANRYNMGSSLSLEEIEQYDYGIRFWERLAEMDKLLNPEEE